MQPNNKTDPFSPGTLGSERFSGILHWSTWSFSAFTSSMSPGTLRMKRYSYTQRPQEGALPLSQTSLTALWLNSLPMHTQLASNVAWWLKRFCSLFVVLLWNKQNKHITGKQHSLQETPYVEVSQKGSYVVCLTKSNKFLNKSRCYRVKCAGENPTQTHSCEAIACL